MKLAGELDDRWLALSLRTGGSTLRTCGPQGKREESPDTVWATRLVTPGDTRRGCVKLSLQSVTESATEKIPPAKRNPVIARRKTFGMSNGSRAGKGEKVG